MKNWKRKNFSHVCSLHYDFEAEGRYCRDDDATPYPSNSRRLSLSHGTFRRVEKKEKSKRKRKKKKLGTFYASGILYFIWISIQLGMGFA